jgi:repressor LexA
MAEETLLNKVKKFYFKYRRMPSYREMKNMFGFASPTAVAWVVAKWIKEGIVEMHDRKLSPGDEFFRLPLLGVIKAGSPTNEPEYETESVSLDQYLIGSPGYTYLLRVSGDSMMNAGINTNDLVILDKKRQPNEGDIVAAFIDNEWTLKYFKKQNGEIYLEPANPKYPPIFPQHELSIGGVVVSVIRKYY